MQFPGAYNVESEMIEQKYTTRSLTVLPGCQGADINGIWPAMHRMRAAISGFCQNFFRFDDLGDFRGMGVGLGIALSDRTGDAQFKDYSHVNNCGSHVEPISSIAVPAQGAGHNGPTVLPKNPGS